MNTLEHFLQEIGYENIANIKIAVEQWLRSKMEFANNQATLQEWYKSIGRIDLILFLIKELNSVVPEESDVTEEVRQLRRKKARELSE